MRWTPCRRAVLSTLACLASGALAHGAAEPLITSLTPLGIQPGQLQDIVIRGSNLSGATQFWTGFPGQASLDTKIAGNGKNPGEVTFRLTAPTATPPGIYPVRIATAQGISPLRLLLIDDLPSVVQQSGSTGLAAAQVVRSPVAIDGALEPLVRHYFRFHAEAGQRLSFEVFARRIGSLLDPTLRLLDGSGREITYSDDVPGLSEDAAIDYTFPKTGDYVVELGDNLYQGGSDHFYRLRTGDFPSAVMALPCAASRGSELTFRFADRRGSEILPVQLHAPTDPTLAAFYVPARFSPRSPRSFATVLLSAGKQYFEVEPNDNKRSANRVEFGESLNGRLQAPGDVDCFMFHARRGQSVRFTSISRRLGSPADLVLRLTSAKKSQLAYAEGNGPQEATLGATFVDDGDYMLDVRDLNRRGGPRYVYHIDTATTDSALSFSVSTESLNIPAGGTAVMTVTAHRVNYGGPITLRGLDLPSGVTSGPAFIGPGQDGALLSLSSRAEATAGKVFPIRITGSAHVGHNEIESPATVASELGARWGEMPYSLPTLATATAIGIGPRPSFVLRTEPKQLVIGRKQSKTVKVIAQRSKGFDEPIALELLSPQDEANANPAEKHPLPHGIRARLKPISKAASAVEIAFAADSNAAPGEYTAVLAGTLKKGQAVETQPAPAIALRIK